ncbi:MAG: protoglobin domain-containing protein [Thiotrichales bacterium]
MKTELTDQILDQIPTSVRFNDEDAATLLAHKDLLLTLEDELVKGFYDHLYEHKTTRQVFTDDEREAREKTLRDWYQRTLSGPFDQKYWEWQTFVGLVHIKRNVNNAMVSGMWGWLQTFLGQRALEALPADEALKVIKAVHALQAVVMALISESYQRNMFSAVEKASGLNEALLYRLVSTEINEMLEHARD